MTEKDYERIGSRTGYPTKFTGELLASTGRLYHKNKMEESFPTGAAAGGTMPGSFPSSAVVKKQANLKKDTSEITECTYHLHVTSKKLCWRAIREFQP
jgi:hypothetical protein